MADHICDRCGTPFKGPPEQKFCTRRCAYDARTKPLPAARQCATCSITFQPRWRQYPNQAYCSRACGLTAARSSPKFREGIKANAWKRADKLRGSGKSRYVKRDYKPEHRLVMEQHLGRPLRSDEHVHHDDENTRNNDIGNLVLTTPSEHAKIHGLGRSGQLRDARGRYI